MALTCHRPVLALAGAITAEALLYNRRNSEDSETWTELLAFAFLLSGLVISDGYRMRTLGSVLHVKSAGIAPTVIAGAIVVGAICRSSANVLWVSVSRFLHQHSPTTTD